MMIAAVKRALKKRGFEPWIPPANHPGRLDVSALDFYVALLEEVEEASLEFRSNILRYWGNWGEIGPSSARLCVAQANLIHYRNGDRNLIRRNDA